ncbi:DUF2309 domain-containing protein [Planctomicrobium sp. SH661]|uniref:DUF2309 domain-containing protein n=1 Tax=Planctomicrobium sp. SH661 TaxID=3448124 RepID=UPI003F5C35E6
MHSIADIGSAASARYAQLAKTIGEAAHLLPSQGPIQIFVHRNTLQAFEAEPFEGAAARARDIYGSEPYLQEAEFRQKLASGRILLRDIKAVLKEDLGDTATVQIGTICTRMQLRQAMLQYSLRTGTDAELRWLIAEADALNHFSSEVPAHVKTQMIEETRRWVMRDLRNGSSTPVQGIHAAAAALMERFGSSDIERWGDRRWEAMTLHLLWHLCHVGVHGIPELHQQSRPSLRCRELLVQISGVDVDRMINAVLIPFCAAYLDQGISHWTLPGREQGFLHSFTELYGESRPVESWMSELPRLLQRIRDSQTDPLDLIDQSLHELGVQEGDREEYLRETMLSLRGWAGMLHQMETNAEWAVHPAPAGSLMEYMAVRLLLERLALRSTLSEVLGDHEELRTAHARLRRRVARTPRVSVDQRAFLVFQLAQVCGWKPEELHHQSREDWQRLVEEIELFSDLSRRSLYQQAFERRYRNQTLDAVLTHGRLSTPRSGIPRLQVVCCLDAREGSYRRHLEEVAPDCETFGMAGFYGVAMYYRGVADAHFVPLCPVMVKPQHYVTEDVAPAMQTSGRRRQETRRAIGKTRHLLHTGSRSILGGAMTAWLGTLASFPLVMRVLFPRLTSRTQRLFGSLIRPPALTRLEMERTEPKPGPDDGHRGFTVDEMVLIGHRVLSDMGLTRNFSRLVILTGHGSSCLNNPHESAYDCGACGGGRGGPNARVLAAILNDSRVRERLETLGLQIPAETVFLGSYHNTCDDSVTFFDLDRVPPSRREDVEYARSVIEEARRRNAHERCRRFISAELSMSEEAALRHVEARSEDLSQVRAECGNATNAVGFIGRRARTTGLFMDRRALLTSYDPTADNEDAQILERILQAVIPVCTGINLQYYFSHVDPAGYGCGSKLPHNITALLGVMDGAASDLRPGLPWQMVEIHEPLRILYIIETTPVIMQRILDRNPQLKVLFDNAWVQLAVLNPESPEAHVYRHGQFDKYQPESTDLPVVKQSRDWYRGWRDHLGYARIVPDQSKPITPCPQTETAGV